jgi:hypothetical protein
MKLLLAILVGFLTLSGCGERVLPPSNGLKSIAFELVYPRPTGAATYFGASGVRLVTDDVVIGPDTTARVTGRSFFGQFYTAGGAALPTQVELNGVIFERHLDTDTLRLGATDNVTLFGVQMWRLTDGGTPLTFQSQSLQEIDSVAPLMYHEPVRGDTALVLTWRPPTGSGGGNGVLITWRQSGVETFSQLVQDNGRFAIPLAVVDRFSGDSELLLTRYRTDQHSYKGATMFLTRIAQRNYKVVVLG